MTDREHFEQLAAELGVTVHYTVERFQSGINILTLDAYIEPFKNDVDDEAYFVALHELGHIASEQTWPEKHAWELLENEANAWRWALDHTHRPLTDTGRTEVAGGIGSYLRSGVFPDKPGAESVRALLEALGDVELPWPKTNEAFQRGREAYLRSAAASLPGAPVAA